MMGQKPLAAEECNHQWTPYCEGERCARCGLTVGARFYSKDGGWYTGNVSNAARAEDHTSLPRLVAGRIAMIDDDAENWIGEATRIIADAFSAPVGVETELIDELRSLADCDARAGEPLGKCMRKAADRIELLEARIENIERGWLETDAMRRADFARAKPAPVGVEEIVAVISDLLEADRYPIPDVEAKASNILSRLKEGSLMDITFLQKHFAAVRETMDGNDFVVLEQAFAAKVSEALADAARLEELAFERAGRLEAECERHADTAREQRTRAADFETKVAVTVEEIARVLEKFARPHQFPTNASDNDTTFIEIFGGEWRAARALFARLNDASNV